VSPCRPSREGKRPVVRRINDSDFLSVGGKYNDSEGGRKESVTGGRKNVTETFR